MGTRNARHPAMRLAPVKEDIMDNKELSSKVWANIEKSKKKAAKFQDTVAVSFSLLSEADEDLFVVVENGQLRVEPFRYNDNGCEIEATAETINKLFAGELSFDKALKDGVAVVKSGDVAKFKALECLVPSKKTASKTAAKKPAAKKTATKTAAKKTTAKPAAKKAPAAKAAAKTEEKKDAPAAKPAAPAAKPAAPAAAKPAAPVAKPAAPAAKPAAPAAKPAEKKAADVKPTVKK